MCRGFSRKEPQLSVARASEKPFRGASTEQARLHKTGTSAVAQFFAFNGPNEFLMGF